MTNKILPSATLVEHAKKNIEVIYPFFEKKNRIIWSKIELLDNIDDITHPSIKAILKYFKEKRGVELIHFGDLPARSGIGSSSSFTVGLLNLLFYLHEKKITKRKLSKLAIHVEKKLLKEEGGWQDQIIVSQGGFNQISFFKNNFEDILFDESFLDIFNLKKIKKFILAIK